MEKIKAVYGSEEHPELVKKWLREQGAKENDYTGNASRLIYYVNKKGCVETMVACNYDFLFDIVTLEKPKLKVIKGNKERGNEVIELLESVGGINKYNYKGVYNSYYYIDYEDNIINVRPIESDCFFDNYELEILELPEKEHIFKPFDKVLVRQSNNCEWKPALFWKYSKEVDYKYLIIGGHKYKYCKPYEGNEDLI